MGSRESLASVGTVHNEIHYVCSMRSSSFMPEPLNWYKGVRLSNHYPIRYLRLNRYLRSYLNHLRITKISIAFFKKWGPSIRLLAEIIIELWSNYTDNRLMTLWIILCTMRYGHLKRSLFRSQVHVEFVSSLLLSGSYLVKNR